MDKIIRFQAVLSLAGITKADGPFDDEQILTSCPACGVRQTLGQAHVRLQDGQTRYRCKNDCQDIAFVCDRTPDEFGYQLGNLVFRNLCDVFLLVRGNIVQAPAVHKLASQIDQPGPSLGADDLSSRPSS